MIVAFGLGQPGEYVGIMKYQPANSKTLGPGYVQFVVIFGDLSNGSQKIHRMI